MYCQFCGKETENGADRCEHCGKLLPNAYIPLKKEKRKERKKPSPIPLKVTGIVMYALCFAGFAYEFLSLFNVQRLVSKPYTAELCVFGGIAVLFCAMLLVTALGKMSKALAGTALLALNIIGIGHLIKELAVCVYALKDFEGLSDDWYLIMFLILYVLLAVGLIVMSVFAFLFYYKRKFSPLPMCITTGVYLIFEILSLIGSLTYWLIVFGSVDIRTSVFFITTFVFYAVTIAQLFLYHTKDKYETE